MGLFYTAATAIQGLTYMKTDGYNAELAWGFMLWHWRIFTVDSEHTAIRSDRGPTLTRCGAQALARFRRERLLQLVSSWLSV